MTKDQIHDALRMMGRGFINHAFVEQLAEFLAAKHACDTCTMPGGKHYAYCPNNPTREIDAPSIYGAKAIEADLQQNREYEKTLPVFAEAPKRRKKAD